MLSREEIVRTAQTGHVLHQQGGVTVVRISGTVLKYGHNVALSEAQIMRLVREQTTLLLPTVRDAWTDKVGEREIGYILMVFVEGASPDWSTTNQDYRADIYKQLHNYIDQLHAIHVPCPGPLGGVDVSRAPLFTDYGAGPFKSSSGLEDWFNERLLVCQQFKRAPVTRPKFTGDFSPLVLCHMYIAERNLIIDEQGKVWLLDWAYAGG